MKQKLPPQNLEAEQSVLGSMLIDKDALLEVTELITSEDFYREVHQEIFQSIVSLADKNEPVDLVTICAELEKKNLLEKVGGAAYLATLANITPTAAHAAYYARIVQEKAILRRLIRTATEIVGQSYDYIEDVEEFLDRAEQAIFEIAGSKGSSTFVPLKEALEETF
ncbi:MAG: replicative DNA helicase, partial [Dethiobacteria bacterium]